MKNIGLHWYCNKVSKEDVINVGKWPRRLVLDEWIRYHGYFLRNVNGKYCYCNNNIFTFKCAMSLAKQVQISMVFSSTLLHIFYQLQNQAFNIVLGWRQIFATPRFLSIDQCSIIIAIYLEAVSIQPDVTYSQVVPWVHLICDTLLA